MTSAEATKYFYSPISFYAGKVLKCKGICTPDNREWFLEQNPGTIIVDGHRGDRIRSDDHTSV
jgi:hypothetical protein